MTWINDTDDPENEGVQYILLRVVTTEDADPPGEWDWDLLADSHRPGAVQVEWAGPFQTVIYPDNPMGD
jgi:hypothetical protein